VKGNATQYSSIGGSYHDSLSVYVAAGATVSADALTVITGNHASTSDDDVFGVIVDI
jgi:hypothetical protein